MEGRVDRLVLESADRERALVGAALVLYRQLPKVRRYLAYLPEGPCIDWESDDLGAWLAPDGCPPARPGRVRHPDRTSGGHPAGGRAAQIKEGIADERITSLDRVPPTERSQAGARVVSQLHELGWRPQAAEGGFAAGQPQYNFWIPLVDDEGTRAPRTTCSAGMNQQWRRNIKKAAKEGVEVERGDGDRPARPSTSSTCTPPSATTSPRARWATSRPCSTRSAPRTPTGSGSTSPGTRATWWRARSGSGSARTPGTPTAPPPPRSARCAAPTPIQWQMIRDAMAAGAHVYDLRGITDTLDADDDHVGLIQFKVGTGGEAVEYAGEWDLPLNRALYKAFDLYMKRRG